jgi:predicted secreted protein
MNFKVKSIINGDIKNWIIENTKVKITANDIAVNPSNPPIMKNKKDIINTIKYIKISEEVDINPNIIYFLYLNCVILISLGFNFLIFKL